MVEPLVYAVRSTPRAVAADVAFVGPRASPWLAPRVVDSGTQLRLTSRGRTAGGMAINAMASVAIVVGAIVIAASMRLGLCAWSALALVGVTVGVAMNGVAVTSRHAGRTATAWLTFEKATGLIKLLNRPVPIHVSRVERIEYVEFVDADREIRLVLADERDPVGVVRTAVPTRRVLPRLQRGLAVPLDEVFIRSNGETRDVWHTPVGGGRARPAAQ